MNQIVVLWKCIRWAVWKFSQQQVNAQMKLCLQVLCRTFATKIFSIAAWFSIPQGIFIYMFILVVGNSFCLICNFILFFTFMGHLYHLSKVGTAFHVFLWLVKLALTLSHCVCSSSGYGYNVAVDSTAINILCTWILKSPKYNYVVLFTISLHLVKDHCIKMMFCDL
jgi:hypothetical protein